MILFFAFLVMKTSGNLFLFIYIIIYLFSGILFIDKLNIYLIYFNLILFILFYL